MRTSVILGHPQQGSFSHAIADTVLDVLRSNGHDVHFHDLYGEGFNPVLSDEEARIWQSDDRLVEQHCREIALADGIVIIHPNWWGQPPAILKGWVDRVLRPGVAYDWGENDRGEGVPIGLLRAQVGLVFNTANTPQEREREIFGNPLDLLWRNCIFGLCGVSGYERHVFGVMATSTTEERADWLHEVREVVARHFST